MLPLLAAAHAAPPTIDLPPGLQARCEPPGWCHLTSDLDGDGVADPVVRTVRPGQPVPPLFDEVTGESTPREGPWGLAIVASSGASLFLGAGQTVSLPWSDWQLVDGVPVWTHEDTLDAIPADLSQVSFLSVKNSDTGCAPGLGQNVLVLSGTDAAWALVLREGRWRTIPCGF